MFRKETVFEGYFAARWETSYLSKEFDIPRGLKEWFSEYLQSLLEEKSSPRIVSFDDILPKQVYKKVLENPRTKFRFKIVVEVEEVCSSLDEIEAEKKEK